MAHVGRAYKAFKSVARGFVQDIAASKAILDSFKGMSMTKGGIKSSFVNAGGAFRRWVYADDVQADMLIRTTAMNSRRAARQVRKEKPASSDHAIKRYQQFGEMVDQRIRDAQARRMVMAFGLGSWTMNDVGSRLLDPGRGFFEDKRGNFDLPVIPFI